MSPERAHHDSQGAFDFDPQATRTSFFINRHQKFTLELKIEHALWGYQKLNQEVTVILCAFEDSELQATEINSCSFKQKRNL